MATFGELWTAILPAAPAVGSPTAAQLDRDVGWVRVLKARVPAFDALDPGDVAILPAAALAVVASTADDAATLVEALAAGRCAGIVIVEGEAPDEVLDALAAAAVSGGLPTIRAARADPNALERSAIGFLVNRRAELEHQAGILEAMLEEVALGNDDVAALIAAVAGFLGRAVALEGRRGEIIAVHAPDQAPGAAAAVSAYLGGSRTAALRIPLPATPASAAGPPASSAGRLVLLGDRPASDLERVAGPRVARLLALELARADAVRRAHDAGRRGEAMPADGPPWVMLVARQVPVGAGPAVPVEAREEVRSRLRAIAPARRLALRGDAESLELRIVLAVPPPDGGDAGAEAGRIGGRIAALLERPVAVSRPFSDPGGRPAAEAEARATLEAVEGLAERPAVARADRLPAYRLLATLANLPDGTRHARALLDPILAGSADTRRERLATLRAVLDQPGLNEAAAALGIHRNTLAYRLRRIEQLTGWRLTDPDLHLPLAIAVWLVQSEQ